MEFGAENETEMGLGVVIWTVMEFGAETWIGTGTEMESGAETSEIGAEFLSHSVS